MYYAVSLPSPSLEDESSSAIETEGDTFGFWFRDQSSWKRVKYKSIEVKLEKGSIGLDEPKSCPHFC